MLTGQKVRLRAYRKEDIPKAQEYMNDLEVRRNLAIGIPYPFTLENEEKWYSSLSGMNDTYSFAIETLEDAKYIGGCGANSVDWKNSVVVVGIFIGDKDYWSKGYGTDAMNLLVKFIFEQMNINKVKLNVFGFNDRAIKCYEKCGFVREGVLRQELFRDGRYYDEYIMSILKKEYFAKKET